MSNRKMFFIYRKLCLIGYELNIRKGSRGAGDKGNQSPPKLFFITKENYKGEDLKRAHLPSTNPIYIPID